MAKARLTDAGADRFERFTLRTFYVVDTEYTPGRDSNGNRLISVAVVPVVGGVRAPAAQELYMEMNPGVPISAGSSAQNGFTDKAVARKRRFAALAKTILDAFSDRDGIFVQHTSSDLQVLRAELERLDAAHVTGDTSIAVGLTDLPTRPILDTSFLPGLLAYPGTNGRASVSLARLCELTGASNRKAHNARGDARATADALIELLRHAANAGAYSSIDDILAAHGRGTTTDPQKIHYIHDRRSTDVYLPPEHIARHGLPLNADATGDERAEWVDRAQECAQLRCQMLLEETVVVAATHGSVLVKPLMGLLPGLTEPGQTGTLIGAVSELISPSDEAATPAIPLSNALRWWAGHREAIRASVACEPERGHSCPSCRHGEPCPRDVIQLPLYRMAVLGEAGELSQERIRSHLWGKRPDRRNQKWLGKHPHAAAYMAWMVITWELRRGLAAADTHLSEAIAGRLHLLDPRLALLVCESLVATEGPDQVFGIAQAALKHRTTDDAYDDLAAWLLFTEQAAFASAQAKASRPPRNPRTGRPAGRVNPNPYRVS